MLAGILSVVPDFAMAGTDDLQVTFTLDPDATPPPPPWQVDPTGAEIGTIQGTSLARDDMEVTATFDVPAGETVGTKDVAVSFPTPTGTITLTLPGGFSVLGDGLPMVTVAATDGYAAEASQNPGTFTISRAGGTDGDLTVQLSLGGSATEGNDFPAMARTAMILDGQASVAMTVTPVDDDEAESTETVTLSVEADAAYSIGTADSATVSIADDDGVVPDVTYVVVDTGQTTFYDDSGAISTPSVGDPFYGQDAQYVGNQPSYTLSADGLTVYDNVTGLTWTQSPDLDGDSDIDVNDKVTYDEALVHPNTLNAQNYGGYSDWRLPTIKELYSLIDFRGLDPSGYEGTDTSGLTPFIDTDYFDFGYGDTGAGERIIDAQMASSTLYVGNTANDGGATLFGVNFADGRIKGYGLTLFGSDKTFYAYFVRGNTDYGLNQFADNGDGTIADNATGLVWSQDDSGSGMNWEDALAWVQQKNDENYLGHNDWRLPDAKELQSIVDYTRSPWTTNSAAIDPLFNTTAVTIEDGSTDYPFYWSGTTHANWLGGGDNAAYISFGEASGYMSNNWVDVHGAGAQRSDPKEGNPADWPTGHGPQGDAIRIYNYVRLVRDADATASTVVGRHVFYNNSYWDDSGNDPSFDDNTAIASDKAALLPGQVANFANYTSYSRGINGVMVDIAGLPDDYTPIPADFEFRVGNDNDPAGWSLVTAVPTVTLRPGDGDYNSDRIAIIWDDGEICNTWLEVTVEHDNLGLADDDVFYYGNTVAESGDSPTDAKVTVTDLLLARNNPRSLLDDIGVTFPYDFDRDGQVDAMDVLLARNNQTSFLDALNLIDLSGVTAEAQETSLADLAWFSEFDQPAVYQRPTQKDDAVDLLLAVW